MTAKLTVVPTGPKSAGAWIEEDANGKRPRQDAHVIAENGGITIGVNEKCLTANLGFTDLALHFGKDGAVTFQYDAGGTPVIVPMDAAVVRQRLRGFLEALKIEAQG